MIKISANAVLFLSALVKTNGNYISLSNETVHWGYFSKTIDPIMTVASGEKVVVEVRKKEQLFVRSMTRSESSIEFNTNL